MKTDWTMMKGKLCWFLVGWLAGTQMAHNLRQKALKRNEFDKPHQEVVPTMSVSVSSKALSITTPDALVPHTILQKSYTVDCNGCCAAIRACCRLWPWERAATQLLNSKKKPEAGHYHSSICVTNIRTSKQKYQTWKQVLYETFKEFKILGKTEKGKVNVAWKTGKVDISWV